MNVYLCLILLLICFSTCSLEVYINDGYIDDVHLIRVKRAGRSRGGCNRRRGNQMNPMTLLLGMKAIALKAILLKTLLQRSSSTPAPNNGTSTGRK